MNREPLGGAEHRTRLRSTASAFTASSASSNDARGTFFEQIDRTYGHLVSAVE